jgi:metal-sulfur cluster biosynthetic enzyme
MAARIARMSSMQVAKQNRKVYTMSESQINEIQWTIHTTHPEFVQQARASLSEVVDPEIGMNIIQLGLVRDIEIENNMARLKMILTTPFCPYGPAMIEMTKAKATEGLNMPVTVEMGMDMWDFSMMEDPSALDWGMYS